MSIIPVSPLSLNQLTRDYWGQYDPAIIAQLAKLASDPCYSIKFYKSPADDQELFDPWGYVTHGQKITPGSVIFGLYLPVVVDTSHVEDSLPLKFTVQVTDVSLERKWWDDPVGSIQLANHKPVYQSDVSVNMGSFPSLLDAPYPVVGSGQFDIELQNTRDDNSDGTGTEQRIQLVLGVLEVCSVG